METFLVTIEFESIFVGAFLPASCWGIEAARGFRRLAQRHDTLWSLWRRGASVLSIGICWLPFMVGSEQRVSSHQGTAGQTDSSPAGRHSSTNTLGGGRVEPGGDGAT
jgi:hypothetical protein